MDTNITVALIAIVPTTLAAVFGYLQGARSTDANRTKAELSSKRIRFAASPNPNFKELVYPNYGMSLLAPVAWLTEDSPARLAGGEYNLISRYEDTGGAIGINFRLRPVQPNYINNVGLQVENQRETFEKSFPDTSVEDAAISGLTGKLFKYKVPTGKRRMDVRLYWIRVVPDVQLQIQCAQYEDAADTREFWRDADQIVSSIVIAFDAWQNRYKKDKGV